MFTVDRRSSQLPSIHGRHRADPAERAAPGEYFLAAESIHVGPRYFYGDSVYEVVGEPQEWGMAWYATLEIAEGIKPGARFNAMLHTGKPVN